MIKLLERNIASVEERLVLLAPPAQPVPSVFRNVTVSPTRYRELLDEMQALRGSIYLNDGAVTREQLSGGGRHRTPEDAHSWHLLMLNRDQRVSSCVWYMEHQNDAQFEDLRVRSCPLSRAEGWSRTLWQAIESELSRARQLRLRYAEVGGWAVAKTSRCTSEGLLLALAAYSLGRTLGGALGLTTATVRHASSTILKRLGGGHLEADGTVVPPYYDPKYRCDMELLRFDSRNPNPKYVGLIERLHQKLADVRVLTGASAALPMVSYDFGSPASSSCAA
jgi:hypothetical protein